MFFKIIRTTAVTLAPSAFAATCRSVPHLGNADHVCSVRAWLANLNTTSFGRVGSAILISIRFGTH